MKRNNKKDKKILCKYYNSKEGCLYGAKCFFLHDKKYIENSIRYKYDNSCNHFHDELNNSNSEISDEIEIKIKLKYSDNSKIGIFGVSYMRIFGDKFVSNNFKKCYISCGKNKLDLSPFVCLNDSKIIEIKIKGFKNITDMSHMFEDCSHISSISFLKINTRNIKI